MSFRPKVVLVLDTMLVGGACLLTIALVVFLVVEASGYVLG